jgi:hypothetical protein
VSARAAMAGDSEIPAGGGVARRPPAVAGVGDSGLAGVDSD